MDEHHYLLIIGYLEGRITEEEIQYILQKAQTDKEFSDAFEDIAEIWSAKKLFSKDSGDKVLAQLNNRIDRLEPTQPIKKNNQEKLTSAIVFGLKPLLAMAASIIMLLGFFFLYQNQQHIKPSLNATALEVTQTSAGQKKKIKLPDGTLVILNSSSSLQISAGFNKERREVHLQGEAWFDVQRNPQKPFIVHTGKVATQVLGTHFNVSAYLTDSTIAVSLVQGKVQVDINNDPSKRIILDPGKEMIYSKKDQVARVSDFIISDIAGWKDNKLVFNYDSWPDAAKKLSRWYGIPVELKDSTLLRCKLKGTFDNIPFVKVMEQIRMVSDINWKMEGKKAVISGKCN